MPHHVPHASGAYEIGTPRVFPWGINKDIAAFFKDEWAASWIWGSPRAHENALINVGFNFTNYIDGSVATDITAVILADEECTLLLNGVQQRKFTGNRDMSISLPFPSVQLRLKSGINEVVMQCINTDLPIAGVLGVFLDTSGNVVLRTDCSWLSNQGQDDPGTMYIYISLVLLEYKCSSTSQTYQVGYNAYWYGYAIWPSRSLMHAGRRFAYFLFLPVRMEIMYAHRNTFLKRKRIL